MTETTSRARIMGNIRQGLRRAGNTDSVRDRLARPPRQPTPSPVAGLGAKERVALFVDEATAAHATVERLARAAVPEAVVRYLRQHNLAARAVLAPDPSLDRYPWAAEPLLELRRDRARIEDAVAITGAVAGIAETGSLLFASGQTHPATTHLLPDTHIVVLPETAIVGRYEEVWDILRRKAALPRTATIVTGPSRTGDIEQSMQLGAHGPRRLHILLVGHDSP